MMLLLFFFRIQECRRQRYVSWLGSCAKQTCCVSVDAVLSLSVSLRVCRFFAYILPLRNRVTGVDTADERAASYPVLAFESVFLGLLDSFLIAYYQQSPDASSPSRPARAKVPEIVPDFGAG